MAPSRQGQSRDDGPTSLHRLATPHLVRLLGDWRGGGTAYLELAAALRALILDGRLPPHTRIPAERVLAGVLGVSRNTATGALDVLRDGGYLASRRGSGSWVTLPPAPYARPDEPLAPAGDVIDLTLANLPAPPELAALAGAAATALTCELTGNGYEPFGLPRTRAAVAEHLTERGLPTSSDQVLITQGALHAWDLALRALARPGDRVLVETPTYPAALDAIRAHGCVAVAVPVGPGGWDLSIMSAVLSDTRPRLAYLVPDFQNPTGASVPAEQRAAMARAARAAGTILVSDESLAELELDPDPALDPDPRLTPNPGLEPDPDPRLDPDHRARPGPDRDHVPNPHVRPPSLAVGDPGTGVLAVGSLSKPVWGGLRTGWIRADPELVRRLALARASQDVGNPVLDQLLATEVLQRLSTLLPGRRALLRERCDALIAAVNCHLPSWRVERPRGGMSAWAELPAPTAASGLAVRALDHGVRIAPGARFSPNGGFEGRLRLPFTQPPDRLAEAVRRLAAAEISLRRRRPPTSRGPAPGGPGATVPPLIEPPPRWVT